MRFLSCNWRGNLPSLYGRIALALRCWNKYVANASSGLGLSGLGDVYRQGPERPGERLDHSKSHLLWRFMQHLTIRSVAPQHCFLSNQSILEDSGSNRNNARVLCFEYVLQPSTILLRFVERFCCLETLDDHWRGGI